MRHFKALPPCLSQAQRDYLWSLVSRGHPADCWPFNGEFSSSGYPRVWIGDIEYVGTRIAYLDYYGQQPGEKMVCHSCDTPSCMNPHHFFLGTHYDNMCDKKRKQRQSCGERHALAKLTESDVRDILLLEGTKTAEAIGAKYGVSKSTIKAIFEGRNWSSVTGRCK